MAKTILNVSPVEALRQLSLVDARLGSIINSVGSFDIKMRQDPFQSLVEAIIYQQLAGSAADAIYGRFVKIYGHFPGPAQILATRKSKLRAAGLSSRKIEYLKDLSLHVKQGRLRLDLLSEMADEQIVEQLVKVKGIGRWTAEMFLIFCMGRSDVLPVGDLGLRKAVQRAYSLAELPSPTKLRDIAKVWKPYSTVATWYLWKSLEKFKGIG
ncbi:MAG: DNA-3-methyladenine glycosylase [Nitrososphaera sp.]|nr:DNA-3-methyladenine glycosylase [Nitrososphaera sp.]